MAECAFCGGQLSGLQTKFCSRSCHDQHKRQAERLAREARIPSLTCQWCASAFVGRVKPGLQSSYCSDSCRRKAANERNKTGDKRRRTASKPLSSCQNPYCRCLFSEPHRWTYCSAECSEVARERRKGIEAGEAAAIRLGFLEACRIYYFKCCDCDSPIVRKWKRPGKFPCCRPCARRRYLEHMARKNHKRRAAGPKVLSVYQIAERDGRKCSICARFVDMSLSGRAKWGPTIEHLTPVSKGGTNDPENLALSHRHCNVSRGNRGHAQLLLTA